jgi:hypothetical protein
MGAALAAACRTGKRLRTPDGILRPTPAMPVALLITRAADRPAGV